MHKGRVAPKRGLGAGTACSARPLGRDDVVLACDAISAAADMPLAQHGRRDQGPLLRPLQRALRNRVSPRSTKIQTRRHRFQRLPNVAIHPLRRGGFEHRFVGLSRLRWLVLRQIDV